jgi:hypothetical protein
MKENREDNTKNGQRKRNRCINGLYGLYKDKNGNPYFDDTEPDS